MKYYDKKFHFQELFDPDSGFYMRSDVLHGDESGHDPFMRSFPNLMDIGIMGHCEHGKSGLCAKSGIQCYQNGLKTTMPNMKLEDYQRIVLEAEANRCYQIALGGRGDPDMHENFEEIIRFTREHNIIPNFTTSGLGMTEEKAELCKQYCGAVAVSWYSRLTHTYAIAKNTDNVHSSYYMVRGRKYATGNAWDSRDEGIYMDEHGNYMSWHEGFAEMDGKRYLISDERSRNTDETNVVLFHETNEYTSNAIKMLLKAGVTTNVHFVLGKNTIDEAITRLRYNLFPAGINAVVFLLHKPVGQGQSANVLQADDPKLKKFFETIDEFKGPFQIGFDSCTIPGIINTCKNIDWHSLDSCEGGRFSMYVTSDMKALPCSFDNVSQKWAFDMSKGATITDAWWSESFEDFRNHHRNSCPNCPNRHECRGGCPICPEIVLCKSTLKE